MRGARSIAVLVNSVVYRRMALLCHPAPVNTHTHVESHACRLPAPLRFLPWELR